jgi:ABC-2 type transport system permease protein
MVSGEGIGDQISAIGVIVAWTIFGVFFAVRGFSWEARRS